MYRSAEDTLWNYMMCKSSDFLTLKAYVRIQTNLAGQTMWIACLTAIRTCIQTITYTAYLTAIWTVTRDTKLGTGLTTVIKAWIIIKTVYATWATWSIKYAL